MTFDEIEERAAAQARADVRQVAVPSFPRPEEMLAPVLRAIGLEGADRQQQNAAWDAYRAELREVEKTRGRGEADWRQVARGLLDFYCEEGKLTARAVRCERARVVDELRAESARQAEEHGGADLDAADWIVILVKRLGRVGDCVMRLDMTGQRRELLGLGVDVLACIAQIDRRLAPRSGR